MSIHFGHDEGERVGRRTVFEEGIAGRIDEMYSRIGDYVSENSLHGNI